MVQSRGLTVVLAVLLFASSAAVSSAQQPTIDREPQVTEPESRRPQVGLIKRIRAWIDRQHERYEEVADRLDRVGLSPDVGTLGQGSGLAAGVRFRRDALGVPGLDLETSAGFSYRGYERYELRLGSLGGRGSRTTLRPADDHVASHFDAFTERTPGHGVYADVRYRHSPLHRFFGIGPAARREARTSFLARGASYDIVTEYQPTRTLGFAVRGGLIDLEVGPGEDGTGPATALLFDDRTAPGLARQPAYRHVGAAVAFDRRDSAASPHSGGTLGVLVWRFDALDTATDDFSRVAIDARYYLPALGPSVLALRALTSTGFAGANARVPFYMQQTLGGGDTLRGFERARFRDTALVNLAAEYRWDVHPIVEVAGFGDVGRVGPSLRALMPRRFERSWGAGIRVKRRGSVKFRVDLAFSREGQRLILSTSPVF